MSKWAKAQNVKHFRQFDMVLAFIEYKNTTYVGIVTK